MKLATIFCILIISLMKSHGEKSNPFTYYTEIYPPWNYVDNDSVTGLSPELMRLIWKKLTLKEKPINVLPWARAYHDVRENKNTVLMTPVKTAERAPLFKWVGPISSAEYILIGLSSDSIKISTIDDAKRYTIGSIREDAAEQLIIKQGIPKMNVSSLNTLYQAVNMLKLKRVDLIAYEKRSFIIYCKKEGIRLSEFQNLYLISKEHDHYAFNITTPDSVIHQFQKALDSLHSEHQRLIEQFIPHIDTDF